MGKTFEASLCTDEPSNPDIYTLVEELYYNKKEYNEHLSIKSLNGDILYLKPIDIEIDFEYDLDSGEEIKGMDFNYLLEGKIIFDCKDGNDYYIEFDLRGDDMDDCISQWFEFTFNLLV